MASTGKIFSDSSNIYQDQARLLFNYYEQAAEQIVKQEEAIEKQISDLEAYRQEIEIKKSDIWKWFLTIIAFFMYFIRKKQYEEQILEIDERIGEKKKEHENIFRDYKVTKMGVGLRACSSANGIRGQMFRGRLLRKCSDVSRQPSDVTPE